MYRVHLTGLSKTARFARVFDVEARSLPAAHDAAVARLYAEMFRVGVAINLTSINLVEEIQA